MKISSLLLTIFSFLMVMSCSKPTVESETKKWNASIKRLANLSVQYPGFKDALREVKTQAGNMWDEAVKVTEEEKKIEAMAAANKTCNPSFVRDLEDISDAMESLKDVNTEAAQEGVVDAGDQQALRIASHEAMMTLSEIEAVLRNTVVADPEQANFILSDLMKKIKKAEDRIDDVMDKVQEKKSAIEAEKNKQKAADAAKAAEEEAAKQPVKCSYCGSMNEANALQCSSCSAPIEK